MGYCHHVYYTPAVPELRDAFPRLASDTRLILARLAERGVACAGPHGDGEALLSETVIAFNGRDPEHCETFRLDAALDRRLFEDWIKTAGRPYDLAVMAVLLRAKQLVPANVAIASDGAWDDEWVPALELVEELFGPAAFEACPLEKNSTVLPEAARRT